MKKKRAVKEVSADEPEIDDASLEDLDSSMDGTKNDAKDGDGNTPDGKESIESSERDSGVKDTNEGGENIKSSEKDRGVKDTKDGEESIESSQRDSGVKDTNEGGENIKSSEKDGEVNTKEGSSKNDVGVGDSSYREEAATEIEKDSNKIQNGLKMSHPVSRDAE